MDIEKNDQFEENNEKTGNQETEPSNINSVPPEELSSYAETSFSNHQVDLTSLPKIEDVVFIPLQKNSLYVSYIVTAIFGLIMITGLSITAFFAESVGKYYLEGMVSIVLLFLLILFAEKKSFEYSGYGLREHDILYREGWLWKSVTTVPFNRIQHIEVNQGPFDRLFDLSTITVYTAGGSSSDMEIDGILQETAYHIKEYIMNKNKIIQDDGSEE